MYTVCVQRQFIARHFLIGGDWGAECELHSHHYRVEVRLEGPELDGHGYLVDIVDIESALDALICGYQDRILNELPEFRDLNPSLERFARFFHDGLESRIPAAPLSALAVTLWENENAWARYRSEL